MSVMIRQFSQTRILSRSFSKLKPLVTTEEFPFNVALTPSKATPDVIKESKINSGIKLVSRDSNSSVVNIKVAVLGGSSAETYEQKGAAHFLAAAAYSGNHKNSGLRVVRYLESLGAIVKSSADREKIVFDVTVLADRVDSAFAGLATAVSSPPHAQYVFEEEVKTTAKLQYHLHHDDHKAQVLELLHEAAYGETAPLGGSLFAQNVDRLSYKEILEYRQKHFVADNIVVAASGISHEKLQSLVEQHVVGGKLNVKASAHTDIELEVGQIHVAATQSASLSAASPYTGGEAKLRQDLGGESHVGLAFPIPPGEAVKPFLVLNALLAQKFGEDNVFLNSYSRGGLSGYYTSGHAATVGTQLEAVIAEIKTIASGAVDVSAAKTKVALAHFLALEGGNTTGVFLNAHTNGVSPHTSGDVRSVTAEQVAAAAKAALKSSPAYAVYGTTAHTPTYSSLSALWK